MTVAIRCVCPGGRHPDGDTVTLAEKLTPRQAATMMHAVSVFHTERATAGLEPAAIEEVLTVLSEAYVKYGLVSWTLEDDQGPIPVTPKNVERYIVEDMEAFLVVGDAADDLYSEAILVPLIQRASASSADTPTIASTSAPTGSPPEESTPSKPSLTSIIPMDDTETTGPSPAGDSRSSPRWASVG